MRISFVLGDIAIARHPVIVNAANRSLVGSVNPHYWRFKNRVNVDSAVHKAAGPELRRECEALPETEPHVRCPEGESRLTKAHGLPHADWVVHAVAPIYENHPTRIVHCTELLASAYRDALSTAASVGAPSVAVPALGCGVNMWEHEAAVMIALREAKFHQAGGLAGANIDRAVPWIEFVVREPRLLQLFEARYMYEASFSPRSIGIS